MHLHIEDFNREVQAALDKVQKMTSLSTATAKTGAVSTEGGEGFLSGISYNLQAILVNLTLGVRAAGKANGTLESIEELPFKYVSRTDDSRLTPVIAVPE